MRLRYEYVPEYNKLVSLVFIFLFYIVISFLFRDNARGVVCSAFWQKLYFSLH